jgi:uncharacterized delta-60 repeat protein
MKLLITCLFIVEILSIPVNSHSQGAELPLHSNPYQDMGSSDNHMGLTHVFFQKWIARYNGPGNDEDKAYSIAVDADGNVYVTGESKSGGYSTEDYATIKYDTDGNELWIARYNGPDDDQDRATSIAVDADGNVYVTGDSDGIGTRRDYATIKYDSDGNELWVARYNGPGDDWDVAYAIALDADRNVYVTGASANAALDSIYSTWDYATIKYDTDGNRLWVRRYNDPANGQDKATSIALDADGNVYVTGRSMGSETDYDYATIKYDTDGNELWVKRYNGPPGDNSDKANSIAVDADGNVYVTGESIGVGTNYDYATIKYDTDGNESWIARYNGPPGDGSDKANSIALDADRNVYVTGQSRGDGTAYDYATIKYDTEGNELWIAIYNGTVGGLDEANSIALDADGNVYVTGESEGLGTDYDYATIKYGSKPPYHMIPVR